jgi:DNA gyrase/topoisomerase IV subunit B
MENNRDNKRQGIFPIRGKLPNCFTTQRDKFLANAEVAAIITLIGGGYGRNFNIDDVKWDKIVISTDADLDGCHIRALLLRFFIMYMPQLVQAGKVYSTEPPLYGVKKAKKTVYFKDKICC